MRTRRAVAGRKQAGKQAGYRKADREAACSQDGRWKWQAIWEADRETNRETPYNQEVDRKETNRKVGRE